ncbi:4-oxalomesaconate tautomerase [Palleronia abyssalis]|uniref:4-oxalomesaconate tautomerase n=1 Tax=Palleronia abyssalis TaxID=1501240 RepID=A0A2R8BVK1_9RHOB|nr:4-oxalomesaconate tautomerase [Palleronia abyssalis]SPJ24207.1 4-oxalomesaconate tautomerase [Palleronia abyssalis]
MSDGVRVMWMRGGTSKGGYFLADDLPSDRDAFLLSAMGSPDPRQIDGMGGGDPLTSKIAVIRRSNRAGIDVDYLFLQVFVDQPVVSDGQNCGNILAGVGPFAVERGLADAVDGETEVAIYMENTGQTARATFPTPGGRVSYSGEARIDGVPGTAAPVALAFEDTAGSTCGALLPTGNRVDQIEGVACTLIDNGMPCVVMRADALGIKGDEDPADLEANADLREKLEAIRAIAGPMMNLGDISEKSVPKMTLVSPPRSGGTLSTRTFIPHRCHKAIGVLGAVSAGSAALLSEGPAVEVANLPEGEEKHLRIEHPTGETTVVATLREGAIVRTGILRTARKLMDGHIFG